MARTDRLDAGNIQRKLVKRKYKVSGRVGAKKTRLKATGRLQNAEGVVTVHELVLELELLDGTWRPIPPATEEFTSASSTLRSESNGCTTRAFIRDRGDLERALIKMGALEPVAEPMVLPRSGGRGAARGGATATIVAAGKPVVVGTQEHKGGSSRSASKRATKNTSSGRTAKRTTTARAQGASAGRGGGGSSTKQRLSVKAQKTLRGSASTPARTKRAK